MTEINGGDGRRFFLGRIVFGQRREFAVPEILDAAEIDQGQKPREQDDLRA